MVKIIFQGWQKGLDKIKLIKLIREDTQMTLRKAHSVVDELVFGNQPFVTLDVGCKADHLVSEARKMGVKVETNK